MPTFNVQVKHAGKTHKLSLNTDAPPLAFKDAVYAATGVPLDRMKVMVKGGILKDDSDWSKSGIKEGQTIMVIGAAGELPKPPSKPIVFLEDMDESELAEALALPGGLTNLGNTCYMNATLQTLRAIPELQQALIKYPPTAASGPVEGNHELTQALGSTYASMRNTTGAFTPFAFLGILRQVVPQFAERASGKGGMAGYAQQDAEECWIQILNNIRGLQGNVGGVGGSSQTQQGRTRFLEQYMMGEMRSEMKCDEAPEEPSTVSMEKILKLECNITKETNYMHSGILDAFDQTIEKTSHSLGRQAIYSRRSRLSRIPVNLTVHMVRFAWKREINQKAKIMRKVKFPLEFDVLDLCTDELKAKITPLNKRLREIEHDRAERRKVRKRTKSAKDNSSTAQGQEDVNMSDANANAPSSPVLLQSAVPAGHEPPAPTGAVIETSSEGKGKASAEEGGELEPESVYRKRELEELEALTPADLKSDVGCSVTGLYELIGIITHKGAEADGGHYIGFGKKNALHPVKIGGEIPQASEGGTSTGIALDEDDQDWYKFDDDKVSIFPEEKIPTLEGGGEDSSAYVLLYRSKSLA